MDPKQMGIYFSAKQKKVVRVTSPYWIPEAPEWVLVTNEANSTLVNIRNTIKDKRLLPDPSDVTWGTIPLKS